MDKKHVSMRIGVVARLKQGDILEAIRTRGWSQKRAAEFLDMEQSTFGRLINLQWVPQEFSPTLSIKLFELTGKTPEDLFPEFARQKDFLEAPKVIEVLREVTPRMLAGRGLLRLAASPEELVEKAQLKEAVAKALHTLSPRKEKVVQMRVFEGATFEIIAREIGCTNAGAQAIYERALRELREPGRAYKLRPFIGR